MRPNRKSLKSIRLRPNAYFGFASAPADGDAKADATGRGSPDPAPRSAGTIFQHQLQQEPGVTVSVSRRPFLTNPIALGGVARISGELGIDVPRQKFLDAVDGMFCDAGQHVAKIALRLNAV
jgi:hypothetical protein